MLRILTGTFRNFLTIGNITQSINLSIDGLTLVLGENLDIGGANSRNGVGKAQPLTSHIKIPGGWTTMGEVSVGDVVSTPDGAVARVIGTFPQGEKSIYRVTFADGRSVECCDDHLWKVWLRKCDWGWHTLSLKDIMSHRAKMSKLSGRVYVPLVADVPEADVVLPLDPKLLGILIGDGNIKDAIRFSSADQEIIDYVALCLPIEYSLKMMNQYDYRISRSDEPWTGDFEGTRHKISHIFGKPLHELGLRGLGSHEKFIPEIYKHASLKQRLALLQGLMDTDGYVCDHGTVSFCTTSAQLALDVQELIRSIGGIASIREKHPSYTYDGEKRLGRLAYNVRIRYASPSQLVSLPRKRARISEAYQYANSLRLEICSIEHIGQAPAKCIQIDHPDQLYITDNHVVTHNTAVLQAISYGLFGKPLTKIRLDNLVNSVNNKGMLVTIDFESNGKPYRIERGRKPALLRFYKDGAVQKEFDESQGETKHTQTEIERIIGMSYVMFRHIVALNTSTTPFLREEVSVQREVIEELFGIMQLSQRAEALKKLIDVTKDQSRNAEATVKANGEANARITAAIDRAQNEAATWQVTQQRRIADLAKRAAMLDKIDIDHEMAIFDQIDDWHRQQQQIDGQRQHAEQQIASLTADIDRLHKDTARYEAEAGTTNDREIERLTRQAKLSGTEADQDIQPQIDRLRSEIVRRQREAADTDAAADQLATELASVLERLAHPDAHTCTTCGQGLVGTDHLAMVMSNLADRRQRLDDMIAQLNTDHARATHEAILADGEIERLYETDRRHRDAVHQRATALQGEIEQATAALHAKRVLADQQAVELRQVIARTNIARQEHMTQRDALRVSGTAPVSTYHNRDAVWQVRQDRDRLVTQLETELARPNPIEAKIDGLRSTVIEVDFGPLNDLVVQLKHENFLLKLLTAKESFVRKKIIDQNLSYLNKRLNHYLDRLGLPHEVVFQPDLTVEIMLLGREFDFEQLSRGEMNRVILATAFSFRDCWENLNTTVNLMFVDECLDQGTDGAGVEAALNILTTMALDRHKSVFLISHREELRDRIDHVMVVRKENQFTSFA